MAKLHIWLLVGILFLPSALFGQKEPKQPKYNVQVNLVSLDVEVLDKKDNLVPGLTWSDFVVEENGKSMEISNFALSTDKPVSLAAVLDTSSLSTEQLIACKTFLRTITLKLDRTDEVCLFSFDARDAYLESDFSSNRMLLWSALDNIGVPSHRPNGVLRELMGVPPPTGLAVDLALLKLREAHNGKKALLLISNRFRGLGPATVEHVQESACTLLTLAFSHKTSLVVAFGDAISTHQLMRESGGRKFSADSQDIEGVCQQIVSSLKNYYSIGYLAEITPGEKQPRKIRIRVPGHQYTVNFRRTYIPQ